MLYNYDLPLEWYVGTVDLGRTVSNMFRCRSITSLCMYRWQRMQCIHLSAVQMSDVKPFAITRIYADKDGSTKFGAFNIKMKGSGDIGYLSKKVNATGVIFRLTPSKYHYPWHNAPQCQFIVNLDADVEIEVTSGEKRVIKQGEVFFVEDITGKGHYSKAVKNQSRHSLFIPVSDDFTIDDYD